MPHNTPVGKNVTRSTLLILLTGLKILQPWFWWLVFYSEEIVGKDFSHNVILKLHPLVHFPSSPCCQRQQYQFVQSFPTIKGPSSPFFSGYLCPFVLLHSWLCVLAMVSQSQTTVYDPSCIDGSVWDTCVPNGLEKFFRTPWSVPGFILAMQEARSLWAAASGHWLLMMWSFFVADGSPVFILQIWLPACLLCHMTVL